MANTEPAVAPVLAGVERLDELAPATLAMLDDLVVASHWNQVEADWRVFFTSGTIYVIRDERSRIVASGAVLPMGAPRPGCLAGLTGRGVAWISMILVLPEYRGQGLGRRVFDRCVEHIRAEGRIAMLDATPAGETLYRQFGFHVLWRLTRWRREARPATRPGLPAETPDLERLAELDQEALGFSRTALLSALLDRPTSRLVHHPLGFAFVRAGRVAHHIGPMVATNEAAAIALLREALAAAGFAPQRGFARMALARAQQRVPQGQPHFIHAVAGPEFA